MPGREPMIRVGLLTLLLAGCGEAAIPHAQSAQTQAAIRAAEEVGAPKVPQGALYLARARDQVAEANSLVAKGDNEKAHLVLRRAEADANLAIALAKEAEAKRDAEAAKARINELQQRQTAAQPKGG